MVVVGLGALFMRGSPTLDIEDIQLTLADTVILHFAWLAKCRMC